MESKSGAAKSPPDVGERLWARLVRAMLVGKAMSGQVVCLSRSGVGALDRRTLLTNRQESRPELSASVLQAFIGARAGTGVRPTGRRCSSGRHVRSFCPL